MPISSIVSTGTRVASLVLTGLLAGSVFAVWRGYDIAQYIPATFIEVHQGAVRGLNVLLPVLGIAAIVLVIVQAIQMRHQRRTLILLIVVALLLAAAALVTRFGNQPINELVMGWSSAALPADWETIRDSWRSWHLVRVACSIAALATLGVALTRRD